MTGNKINIVVFGCDNSGKTTLCNSLKRYVCDLRDLLASEVEVVKSLGPANYEMQKEFMDKMLSEDKSHIFDRFPIIEEMTCGPVLRGKNNFENYVDEADYFLNKIDLFIYCKPSLDSILNWGTREQMSGIKENIMPLIDAYDSCLKVLQQMGLHVMIYNWEEDDIEERLEFLYEYNTRRKRSGKRG